MLLLDRHIKIIRLTSAGYNRSAYTTWTVSIDATIQPLGDQKGGSGFGSNEKLFKVFLEVFNDVREGDQIQDYLGNIYQVVAGGVEQRNDGFMADYLGVVVKKIN